MTLGTLLRRNRLLTTLVLTAIFVALVIFQMQSGISMELGEMALSVQPHQEGGLLVSFVRTS